MLKRVFKIFFTFLFLLLTTSKSEAIQFDVVVLPTDLYNICDNYFCFPEASEIAANNVIQQLNSYKNISARNLYEVREKINQNESLKSETVAMLKNFRNTDKIDFETLSKLSKEFNVKSIVLISTYTTNTESNQKRQLWDILELTSAFKFAHPFELRTSVVLTDTVNNTVMLSNKYYKQISDNNDFFIAQNQAQAYAQLEKVRQYYRNNVAQHISQNIKLRFFPKSVRTFTLNNKNNNEPQFIPNALDKLSKPKLRKEIENIDYGNSVDDFIFEF